MKRSLIGILSAIVIAVPGGGAQQPPRDSVANQPPGSISGVVVSFPAGSSIARAQVRVNRIGVPGEIVRTTGADGTFTFEKLEQGSYRLSASKAGYVPRLFSEGDVAVVHLAAGQSRSGVSVALQLGGVIAGTLTDANGEPQVDVTVRALRIDYVNGVRQVRSGPRVARTNDIGEYRLFGLQPGDYYVVASFQPAGQPGVGAAPGSGVIRRGLGGPASSLWSSSELAASPAESAPIYFPGVMQSAEAQSVVVEATQVTRGIDFIIQDVRASHISGTVKTPDGSPVPRGTVVLRTLTTSVGMDATAPIVQGTFKFNAVAPGGYVAEVRRRGMSADGKHVTLDLGRTVITLPEGQSLDDVEVTLSPGATVSGRVVWEGNGAHSPGVLPRVSALSPTDLPRDPSASVPVLGDGTFELSGVHESVLFRVDGLPQGWFLKDVKLDGRSITDQPHSFSSGAKVDRLEVLLTDRLGSLDGTIQARSRDVLAVSVVVFSADSAKWTPHSRFIRLMRADAERRFTAQGLPDGDYVVALVPAKQQGRETAAESLKENLQWGTRIRVREGETARVALKSPR